MSKLLEASFGSPDRPLRIGDIEIPCYVLNNEKRVLVLGEMIKALGMAPGSAGKGGNDRLASFASGNRVKPFIPNELMNMIENPIRFKPPTGGVIAYGYEATILIDICNSILDANKAGVLQKQQSHIAERADVLIRSFAKTGIIAVIDEVTGFQAAREKDALQQFLDKFLLEENAKWVKTFPDEFFEMIFKMKGWTWHYASTKKPGVVGHYINDLVYSRIAPNVLTDLKVKNPVIKPGYRKYKHPQFISSEFGHPKLKEHLSALIALGKGSAFNWNTFKRLVARAFPKFAPDGSSAPELGFPEDE